jgi:hypothetical protein
VERDTGRSERYVTFLVQYDDKIRRPLRDLFTQYLSSG